MAKTKTDVAVSQGADETTANLPSTDVIDMSLYAGMGREEARAEDYSIPFLRILQKGSPQVDKSEGAFIPGAEVGDFLNTVSGQHYSGSVGLKVIPCLFHREYVEWIPREKKGSKSGFVASYQANDPIVATAKTEPGGRDLILPNGNDLQDTYYEYVLCETPDGDVFPAVISFTSTQTKKVRKWNSLMAQKRLTLPDGRVLSNPPDFAFYYHITTVSEKNEHGSWMGWHIEAVKKPDDRVPDSEFKEALQFYKQVKSGDVKRAPEVDGREPGSDDDYIPGFEDTGAQKVF
jgi:hypothetical protein